MLSLACELSLLFNIFHFSCQIKENKKLKEELKHFVCVCVRILSVWKIVLYDYNNNYYNYDSKLKLTRRINKMNEKHQMIRTMKAIKKFSFGLH